MSEKHPRRVELPKSDFILALEIALYEGDRYFIKMDTRIRWQQALDALTRDPEKDGA